MKKNNIQDELKKLISDINWCYHDRVLFEDKHITNVICPAVTNFLYNL